jgi:hypothetical protein
MFRPLGFLAHKDFNYMAFKYLGFEHLMNAIGLEIMSTGVLIVTF